MRLSHETGDRRFSPGGPSHKKISCLIRKSDVSCFLHTSHEKISWDMRFSHETGDRRFSHEGGCTKKCPVSWENLMSQEKISCLKKISHILSFLAPPHEKISYLLSHEKISGPKRKSHVFSVFGPPPHQENLLSPVSWENLMTQEKILCLFSIGSPPMRKSPVSCLMRKSRVPRENLMSFQFCPPPMRKSFVSCLMRKSHVSRENLMSYKFGPLPDEKISCLLSQEKISCLKRKSHVFSFLGPPNEKIYCLLSPEKISFIKRKSHVLSVLGPPPTRKSPVSCLMRKSLVHRENLMSFQFWVPP